MSNALKLDFLTERKRAQALGQKAADRFPLAGRVLDLNDGTSVPPPLPPGYSELLPTNDSERAMIERAIYHRFHEVGITSPSADEIQTEYVPYLDGSQSTAVTRDGAVVGTSRIKIGMWDDLSTSSIYDLGNETPTEPIGEFDGFSVVAGEPNPFIVQYIGRLGMNAITRARVPALVGLSDLMIIDLMEAIFYARVHRHREGRVEGSHTVYLWWLDLFEFFQQLAEARPAYAVWSLEDWSDETVDYYMNTAPRPIPSWATSA